MLINTKISIGITIFVYLILLIICLLLILLQIRKLKKIKPYKVISEGKKSTYNSSGLKIALNKPFFITKFSFKQFTASIKTYLGSIFVIIILFYFVLIGLSMNKILTPDRMMKEYWGFDWDIMITYKNQNEYKKMNTEIYKLISKEESIEKIYRIYQHMINGLDGNLALFSIDKENINQMSSIISGRGPQNDSEVAITKILADSNNIKIGDEIELKYEENKVKFKITGFFQTISNVGRAVTLTTSGLERLLDKPYNNETMYISYILTDQSISDDIVKKINEKYPSLEAISVVDIWKDYGLMSDAFEIVSIIISIVAIIFVIISSILLTDKIFKREIIDFGIMKAIGFKNFIIRKIFYLRFLIVALIGLIVSSILFKFTGNILLNKLGSFFGLSRLTINISIIQIMISGSIMLIIFWLVAYFVSRKVKKLKVRDLIINN